MTDAVFQFNPRVSNDVTWLSCNTSLLLDSNNFRLWDSSLLILFLLVDLGPDPTLNLTGGAIFLRRGIDLSVFYLVCQSMKELGAGH